MRPATTGGSTVGSAAGKVSVRPVAEAATPVGVPMLKSASSRPLKLSGTMTAPVRRPPLNETSKVASRLSASFSGPSGADKATVMGSSSKM